MLYTALISILSLILLPHLIGFILLKAINSLQHLLLALDFTKY